MCNNLYMKYEVDCLTSKYYILNILSDDKKNNCSYMYIDYFLCYNYKKILILFSSCFGKI